MKQLYTRFTVCFLGAFMLIFIVPKESLAQCSALKPQITIDFETDQPCAPVQVTKFDVTYYFLVAQNPADIQIRYVWNDPANTTTTVAMGTGLIPGAGNTSFRANSTFTYNTNNSCIITPTTYIIIAGVLCATSEQIQYAAFWGTEQEGNANMSITPLNYDVCFNNPVVNATLRDNSEFNCNLTVEPDHPNDFTRHVQFVYGTNHVPASTIRNLSLTDGGPQPLTTATGALANPMTRGTGAVMVTGGYFGPVQTVPIPANGPTAITFPMNAPADVLNLVGNRFEVTLFNWNYCNPWNGDAVNPNYEDAVLTQAYIRIVDAPAPEFQTRDNLGIATVDFCINETIFLANQTPNVTAYNYTWTFYDDAIGTVVAGTRNSRNPTFVYTTGGQKLIRLRASNPAAQGSCIEEVTHLVNITPALIAEIQITDPSDVPITPFFCQSATAPFTTFSVRFRDISAGVATAQTRWRWEFYNENNVVVRQEPLGGGYSSTQLGPFDIAYVNPGIYRIKLIIIDNITLCETSDEVQVHVYENPAPMFTASLACEGELITFTESSTLDPINGESIVSREWDFNYDGVTFNKDPAYDNLTTFSRLLGPGGLYQVALRVVASQQACSAMFVRPVQVNPLPNASFTPSVTSGCSVLTVAFTNNSVTGQPDVIDRFVWETDEGSGYSALATQHPTDPGFSSLFTHDFENTTAIDKLIDVRLRVVTVNGCERISAVSTITINPGTNAGFISLNYSPFNDNCSPELVNFMVDTQTQALNPTNYQWAVSDAGGLISQASTGTTPSFNYNFVNGTQAVKDFFITLTATLPSTCFGDSTRTIRINPVPSSDFDIDTLIFDCFKMRLRYTAVQPGLLEYTWIVKENGIITYSNNQSSFEYEVNRQAPTGSDLVVQTTLQTKNLANCESGIQSKSITVPKTDGINAQFTATPSSQTLPNTTVSLALTTPGTWNYQWDFGDGTTATGATITSHSYATYGTYSIQLIVSNNTCTATSTRAITILAIPPIVDFSYAPPSGCVPLTVTFTNLSRFAEPDKYLWEFGDGQATSKAIHPTYTYYEPGVYTVSLSASNATGQVVKVTKQMIIEAYARPSAQFDIKPKLLHLPGGVLYTKNQSFSATSFLWDFGDGTTSTEREPQHSYKDEGTYSIMLIATNQRGCSDSTTMESAVKVIKGGQVLVPNAFSPNLNGSGNDQSVGKNDVFRPLMRGVTEFEMMIFNRWGELLFQSTDPDEGWDGYYKGKLCQQDVYMYKISAMMENGEKVVRMGDVNLIR